MQLAEFASLDVLLIVMAVVLLVFGSSKLPKIARGLGSAKSEFERGLRDGTSATEVPAIAPTPRAAAADLHADPPQ